MNIMFLLKAAATFFFWGFYGYADEPDVKRMLWSLGEKLWSLFRWRGCCHIEFQMPLVLSTQQVADPTILTSIFCVLQFLPEVFRHETLWSFQHALRDSSSIGGVFSLVTSCNRKITSMYDLFFFKSTIVHRRKSTPVWCPRNHVSYVYHVDGELVSTLMTNQQLAEKMMQLWDGRRFFLVKATTDTLFPAVETFFLNKSVYFLDEGTQFRNWTLGWPEGILGHSNLDPSRMEWNACSLNLSETWCALSNCSTGDVNDLLYPIIGTTNTTNTTNTTCWTTTDWQNQH